MLSEIVLYPKTRRCLVRNSTFPQDPTTLQMFFCILHYGRSYILRNGTLIYWLLFLFLRKTQLVKTAVRSTAHGLKCGTMLYYKLGSAHQTEFKVSCLRVWKDGGSYKLLHQRLITQVRLWNCIVIRHRLQLAEGIAARYCCQASVTIVMYLDWNLYTKSYLVDYFSQRRSH